jgi:hypothetical protein
MDFGHGWFVHNDGFTLITKLEYGKNHTKNDLYSSHGGGLGVAFAKKRIFLKKTLANRR